MTSLVNKTALLLFVALTLIACGSDSSSDTEQDSGLASADVGMETADASTTADTQTEEVTPDPVVIEATTINTGAWIFDARTAGPDDGELVLLLHGFPQTSYAWHAQLQALGEAGYRAVAPNQRGYSATARPDEVADYEVSLLVGDVLAMADALGATQFHVVGHDWGAIVAWALAGAAPERLLTLTAASIPHPDAFSAELADTMSCQYEASGYFDLFGQPGVETTFLSGDAALLRSLYEGLSEEAIEDYVSVLGTPEALGAALKWYRANIVDRTIQSPPLGDITVPTLFIWSDMDTAVCREGADRTEDYVTGPYRFEVLEGVDHWIPERAPDQVNSMLIEHFAQ